MGNTVPISTATSSGFPGPVKNSPGFDTSRKARVNIKATLSIALIILGNLISAQGIRDSIFSINQVEISANRSYQKELAGMKEVEIDTFIMQYQLSSDLATLLQENTTIHIKDYGRGALSTASFRGTAPSHTQVTWNGMNINSPMLGMVDFTLVPMFLVDALKIQHGAASIASQGGGLGGLIAMENRPHWNNTFSGKAYAGFGSFVTSDAFTRVDIGDRKVQTRTRVYSNYSRNNYPFINKNIIERDTVTGELFHPEQENRNAAFRKLGLTQEFYFRLSERSNLSSRTWVQDASRSVPSVLSSEYSTEGLQRENQQVDRTLKHVLEYDTWREETRLKLRSGIDYQLLDYTLESQITGRDPVLAVNSESRMLSWYNFAELQQDLSDQLSLKTAVSLNRYGINTLDSANMSGYDTTRLEGSLMTGLYYSPVEAVQVAAQVRKDMVKGNKTPLIYTLGINAKPFGQHDLLLKANLSRNFHQPTLNDLYWQPGGNPDLLPEEGHTGEVAVSWHGKRHDFSITSSLTGYYSRISNWILWLPGFKGYWEPVNLMEVRSYGLEAHLSSGWSPGEWQFRLHGALALSHTLNMDEAFAFGDVTTGQQLPFIPKISGNVNISMLRKGWFAIFQNSSMGVRSLLVGYESLGSDALKGLAESMTGEGYNDLVENENGNARVYSLYPHYLNNISLGKKFLLPTGTLTLELKIENLFNETYRNVLMRFMPGRSFTLNLKYDF